MFISLFEGLCDPREEVGSVQKSSNGGDFLFGRYMLREEGEEVYSYMCSMMLHVLCWYALLCRELLV